VACLCTARLYTIGRVRNLSETAKNSIGLNPDHSSTVFRVNLYDLLPKTAFYYRVESMDSSGRATE
jgi:hypothetical protein